MTLMKSKILLIATVATAALALAGVGIWHHHHDEHGHDPHHEQAAEHQHADQHHSDSHAGLVLDQGRKWATDAALRQGMDTIANGAGALLSLPVTEALPPVQTGVLSQLVQEQVNFLIQHCTLTPAADAVLHVLIADLLKASEALRQNATATEGLALIRQALTLYPQYFEHQGWTHAAHLAAHH